MIYSVLRYKSMEWNIYSEIKCKLIKRYLIWKSFCFCIYKIYISLIYISRGKWMVYFWQRAVTMFLLFLFLLHWRSSHLCALSAQSWTQSWPPLALLGSFLFQFEYVNSELSDNQRKSPSSFRSDNPINLEGYTNYENHNLQ